MPSAAAPALPSAAATMLLPSVPVSSAEEKGFSQVLWLDGVEQ